MQKITSGGDNSRGFFWLLLIPHFICGSGIWECFSWVVQAQSHSGYYNQNVGQKCSHVKFWLGLDNLLPWCLTHVNGKLMLWCWLLAEGFSSLLHGFPCRTPKYPHVMGTGFSQSEQSKRAWSKSQYLLWPGLGSSTVMSAVSYWLPRSALFTIREDYPIIRTPSWELTVEWLFTFTMVSFRFNKAYFAYTLKPSWWNWWKPKLGVPSYNEICMEP